MQANQLQDSIKVIGYQQLRPETAMFFFLVEENLNDFYEIK